MHLFQSLPEARPAEWDLLAEYNEGGKTTRPNRLARPIRLALCPRCSA